MADMLRITTPINNKNITAAVKENIDVNQLPLNLHQTERVVKTNPDSELLKQNNGLVEKDGGAAILMDMLKDPSTTVAQLKNLSVLQQIISLLPLNNQSITEEIEQLFDGLILTSDNIAKEMQNQENNSTAFKGELFDFLRNVTNEKPSPEMKGAVANLLKALNSEKQRGDILDSLSNGFKYLGKSLQASNVLSNKLNQLAQRFENAKNSQTAPNSALNQQQKPINQSAPQNMTGNMQYMNPQDNGSLKEQNIKPNQQAQNKLSDFQNQNNTNDIQKDNQQGDNQQNNSSANVGRQQSPHTQGSQQRFGSGENQQSIEGGLPQGSHSEALQEFQRMSQQDGKPSMQNFKESDMSTMPQPFRNTPMPDNNQQTNQPQTTNNSEQTGQPQQSAENNQQNIQSSPQTGNNLGSDIQPEGQQIVNNNNNNTAGQPLPQNPSQPTAQNTQGNIQQNMQSGQQSDGNIQSDTPQIIINNENNNTAGQPVTQNPTQQSQPENQNTLNNTPQNTQNTQNNQQTEGNTQPQVQSANPQTVTDNNISGNIPNQQILQNTESQPQNNMQGNALQNMSSMDGSVQPQSDNSQTVNNQNNTNNTPNNPLIQNQQQNQPQTNPQTPQFKPPLNQNVQGNIHENIQQNMQSDTNSGMQTDYQQNVNSDNNNNNSAVFNQNETNQQTSDSQNVSENNSPLNYDDNKNTADIFRQNVFSQKQNLTLFDIINGKNSVKHNMDFNALKSDAGKVLEELENSILYSEKFSKVVSNVRYNLSRYNSNDDFIMDSSREVLRLIDGRENRQEFMKLLQEYVFDMRTQNLNHEQSKVMNALTDIINSQTPDSEISILNSDKINSIIRSILSSPCNFTPLLHFIVPVDFMDMKSFAEIWINPDEEDENSKKSKKVSGDSRIIHTLIVFEIENVGEFEMELYVKDKKINMNLRCPSDYEPFIEKASSEFSKCLSESPYSFDNIIIGKLEKPRSLLEVFKTLPYKRTGVNVKI